MNQIATFPDELRPEVLVEDYCQGIFPMAEDDGQICWYSPDPRAILPLERFHVPRSLATIVGRSLFEIRVNTAFKQVITACSARKPTWISPQIRAAYVQLHQLGLAHSVESWQNGQLLGGLYGVALGGAFMGESMFHRVRDASKVALVALVDRLKERGFELLDVQFLTEHLQRFGAVQIPRREYLQRLSSALEQSPRFEG